MRLDFPWWKTKGKWRILHERLFINRVDLGKDGTFYQMALKTPLWLLLFHLQLGYNKGGNIWNIKGYF